MKLTITQNELNFNLDKLLAMGYRENNVKRNFLFISKCLGKHLMIKPDVCRLTGYALAYQTYKPTNMDINKIKDLIEYPYSSMSKECNEIYKEKIKTNESVTVIGFAETATGLGMSVASAIEDSYYVTSTRELITDMNSCFDFEESHSHATSHQCFLKDVKKLNVDRIILVDDEITTGNTMLNLITAIEKHLPCEKKRKYTILSILDWRSDKQLKVFEDFVVNEKIDVEVFSLISGNIENNDKRFFSQKPSEELTEIIDVKDLSVFSRETRKTENGEISYISNSGRFGVEQKDIESIEEKAKQIYNTIISEYKDLENKKVLILGHGENMYIPSRIACQFKNSEFKTTTRSPIYISERRNYPIKEQSYFFDKGIKYYFYDKSFIEKYYDKVILFTDSDLNIKLCENQITYKL